MPFKALKLSRTNIFYPSSGAGRDLRALLNSLTLTQDALDDIIELEDADFESNQQAANEDDLEQLVTAARKASLLSPALLRKIYFHILRQNAIPKKCGKNDLDALLLAYQDLMAELHRGYPAVFFPKLKGLLVFGYSGQLELDRETPPSYEEFKQRLKLLAQCEKYSHVPGMLAKIEKFRPFADDDKTVQRILALLRLLRYQPSDFTSVHSMAHFSIDLKFWGLITIVLLNKKHQLDLLNDIFTAKTSLPHFDENIQLLARFVDAINDSELSSNFLAFKAAHP